MKKRTARLVALVSVLMILAIGLTGCSKAVCYFCDEEARCTQINFIGKRVDICKECKKDYDSIPVELRNMFIGQ